MTNIRKLNERFEIFIRNRIFTQFQSIFSQNTYNYKGEENYLTGEKTERHHLKLANTINIAGMELLCHLIEGSEKNTAAYMGYSCQRCSSVSSHQAVSDQT